MRPKTQSPAARQRLTRAIYVKGRSRETIDELAAEIASGR
jgi:hypothetical protein